MVCKRPYYCVFYMRPGMGAHFIQDHDSDFVAFKDEKHLFKYYKSKIKEVYSDFYDHIEMFVHGKSIGGFYFLQKGEHDG